MIIPPTIPLQHRGCQLNLMYSQVGNRTVMSDGRKDAHAFKHNFMNYNYDVVVLERSTQPQDTFDIENE